MIPFEALAISGALVFAALLVRGRLVGSAGRPRTSAYRTAESCERARVAFVRLSRSDDAAYLRTSPALASRLRRERRRIVANYLRQVRAEFATTATRARELSAVSDSPEVAARVLKASAAFEALYFLLRLEVWLGAWLPVRVDVSALTRRLSALQAPPAPEAPAVAPVPSR